MKNRERLLTYVPIADFVAAMNGPGCEVVIHDLSNLEHSIIYITKPSITHRTVGGAITDYALALLQSREYDRSNHVVNYLGRTDNDETILRSSTYFIKSNNEVIGLFCVNIDITDLVKAESVIQRTLLVDAGNFQGNWHRENFTMSVDQAINEVVEMKAAGVDSKELSLETRKEIVRELHEKGVFMLKGAIHKIAEMFGVSNQTIYRYVDEVANNET